MSNDRIEADLKSVMRPFAEEAIRPEEAKIIQLVRQALTDAGLVRVERLTGPIPSNFTGVIQDESVEVHFPSFTTATNLQALLTLIIAGLSATPLIVEEVDGSPSGGVRTLVFPNASVDLNTDDEIATITFSGGAATMVIQEQDATVVAAATTLDFAGAGFNVTDDGGGEARIENAITQYTDELAQDAVGTILADSASINFTYTDATPEITAVAIFGSTSGTVAEGDHTHAGGYTDEQVRDVIGAALVAGNNIDITVNDGADTITIDVEALTSADLSDFATAVDERARDAIGTALVAGNNIDITVSDVGDTITIDVEVLTSADLSDFNEAVDDRVGALVVAGNNIDVSYNDGAGTLTIDVETLTSADLSDFTEATQDVLGALLVDSTNIDFTYNDAGNAETVDLTTAAKTFTIDYIINGGGAAITTGRKPCIVVDRACTIVACVLEADQVGSITLNIKKSSYSGYSGSLTSIVASAKPTLSSAEKSTDSTLTGWTTSVSSGDTLDFTVDTVATCTWVTVALKCVAT